MTQKKIFGFIIAAIASLCCLVPVKAQEEQTAQSDETVKKIKVNKQKNQVLQGIGISVDLFGIGAKIFDSDYLSSEIAVEATLRNGFLPIVEIGFGTSDMTDDDKDISYKTSAPYFRLGLNYDFTHKKNTFYAIYGGLRYGFCSLSYDISAPDMTDPVWGGNVGFNYESISCTAQWAELVVGIRAQIWKNLHMGWSVRYKRELSVSEHPNANPYYIPGYGTHDSVQFGATYNIIYYLPFNK